MRRPVLEGGCTLQGRLLGFESHFYHLSAVFDLGYGRVSLFFRTSGNNDNNDFIGFLGRSNKAIQVQHSRYSMVQ